MNCSLSLAEVKILGHHPENSKCPNFDRTVQCIANRIIAPTIFNIKEISSTSISQELVSNIKYQKASTSFVLVLSRVLKCLFAVLHQNELKLRMYPYFDIRY